MSDPPTTYLPALPDAVHSSPPFLLAEAAFGNIKRSEPPLRSAFLRVSCGRPSARACEMASSGPYSTYTSAPVRPVKTETTPLRGKVRDSTGCCGDVCDMAAFEYRADVKDLELDGRHWRELFGGATGGGTKMGAYIICGPAAFVVFRLFLAMIATGIFSWTLVHSFKTTTQGYWALYYTNWTVTLSCAYFLLAAGLTTFAVCTNGQESRRTPVLVWLCWILYGMLVPTAQIAFLAYWLVVFDGTVYAVSIAATVGTLVITLLDMWINRQPYYYSFHAVFGVSIKCAEQAAPTLRRSPTAPPRPHGTA